MSEGKVSGMQLEVAKPHWIQQATPHKRNQRDLTTSQKLKKGWRFPLSEA